MQEFLGKLSTMQRLIIALTLYGALGYLNEFAAQSQVNHEVRKEPLFDRGHNLIPAVPMAYSNVLLIAAIVYFVLRFGIQRPALLENYLWIIAILFLGRVIIFSVTQYPPPSPECSSRQPGDPISANVFRKKGWEECLDLMYSGHTFHTVLVCLFVLYASPYRLEKFVVLTLALLELVLVIAGRLHYTSDVLVSILVTTLIFYAWPGTHRMLAHLKSPPLFG
jgi:hypothetical protein